MNQTQGQGQISVDDALPVFRQRCGELFDENLLLRAKVAGLERQLAAAQEENQRLQQAKPDPSAFGPFRAWREAAEPCRSCAYHDLCRGGCRVVSSHVSGDASAPDPECPKVVEWRATR